MPAGTQPRAGRGARAASPSRAGGEAEPEGYARARDLPRLLPMWPGELDDVTPAGRLRLMSRLRRALRAERQRGIAGHWSYDLARHRLLLAAYRAEARSAARR